MSEYNNQNFLNDIKHHWSKKGIYVREVFSYIKIKLKWVDKKLDYWFFKYVVSPILLSIPPGLTLLYYTKNPVKSYVDSELVYFSSFLNSHSVILLVASVVWLPFWQKVRSFIKFASDEVVDHTKSDLLKLLHTLNEPVAVKHDAIAGKIGEIVEQENFSMRDFFALVSPEKHIEELVRCVFDYFKSIDNENEYKVNLAIIEDEKVVDIKFYLPKVSKVRTRLEYLNHENSAIIQAVKTRKIVVIEDVKKESTSAKSRFSCDPEVEVSPGSLICYPIVSDLNKKVLCVISIYCKTPGTFQELRDHKNYYKTILSFFELRLKLEYMNLVLKEYCNDKA